MSTESRVPRGTPAGGQFAASARTEPDVSLTSPSWRDQPVIVEGRKFTFDDIYGGRVFHGSPHLIEDGATIEPGASEANFSESDSATVSITSGADTAAYWGRQAARDQPYYVYEVEPLDDEVSVWRAGLANRAKNWRLAEGRVHAARILRRIDPADAREYESALMGGRDPFTRTEAVREDDRVDAAVAFAEAYCAAAGGARAGMCHPASWNVEQEFGWRIVGGTREGVTHYWNVMDDGRFFDATAAQFGDDGPQVIDHDDDRYEKRFDVERS